MVGRKKWGQERAFLLSKVGEMAICIVHFADGSDDVGEWENCWQQCP